MLCDAAMHFVRGCRRMTPSSRVLIGFSVCVRACVCAMRHLSLSLSLSLGRDESAHVVFGHQIVWSSPWVNHAVEKRWNATGKEEWLWGEWKKKVNDRALSSVKGMWGGLNICWGRFVWRLKVKSQSYNLHGARTLTLLGVPNRFIGFVWSNFISILMTLKLQTIAALLRTKTERNCRNGDIKLKTLKTGFRCHLKYVWLICQNSLPRMMQCLLAKVFMRSSPSSVSDCHPTWEGLGGILVAFGHLMTMTSRSVVKDNTDWQISVARLDCHHSLG